MGSLPTPPPSSTPQPSETSLSRYRVYVPFGYTDSGTNANVSNIWIKGYNPNENTWSFVTPIPRLIEDHFLKGFSMTSVGDSIYIIGGRLCRRESAHTSDLESDNYFDFDLNVLASVLRYDISDNKWSECASLNTPRYDFACTVCDNKIYVAGGQSTLDGPTGISSAEVYDTSRDEWTSLPKMNTARYKCAGVTWQGKVHVISGFVDRGDSYIDRSSAEVYNEESGKWDLLAGIWQLDVPPYQIVCVNGNLFSSGDCLKAWKGHIEAYDGRLNLWNVVDGSQLEIPSSYGKDDGLPLIPPLCLTMAPIGTHLYFLVGCRMAGDSSTTKSMVNVFDTSAPGGAWRFLEPIEEEGQKELCTQCCVVRLP